MNTLNNQFYEITTSINYVIDQDINLDLLNFNNASTPIKINLKIVKPVTINVNCTVLNYAKYDKQIAIDVIFDCANAKAEINLNCLGLNESKTSLAVNGICHKSINGLLKIKINGIMDGDNAHIFGHPNFYFSTNRIDAQHSLVIGGVNQQELDYLQSRNIALHDAKYLLITAKLFRCLKSLDPPTIKHYQTLILNQWRAPYVKS